MMCLGQHLRLPKSWPLIACCCVTQLFTVTIFLVYSRSFARVATCHVIPRAVLVTTHVGNFIRFGNCHVKIVVRIVTAELSSENVFTVKVAFHREKVKTRPNRKFNSDNLRIYEV